MRNYRFKDLVISLLQGEEGIESVEEVDGGRERGRPLRVKFTNGKTLELSVRNSGGGNHENPEVIIHKDGTEREGLSGPEWRKQHTSA